MGYHCSILHCCPLCQILIDFRDLGLFLGSLFCFIGPCLCSYATTRLFNYSGLVIYFDIRYCDSSYFALLSQNCCSYSRSFMVPYKFLKCVISICEVCHWYFNRDCIELQIALGCMAILMMLILLIHEHGTCFHLFVFLNFFLQCCVVF